MTPEMQYLKELVAKLPPGLRSDWEGTNHYELTCSLPDEFWWLCLPTGSVGNVSATEEGKRLGLLMDIAVAAQQAFTASSCSSPSCAE